MNQINREKEIVRRLAEQVAELAQDKENEHIIQRWKDVNALRKPDRAPVWCRPVGCWKELIPDDILECHDPWLRSLEFYHRQILVKKI